jgi:cytochrome c oxidase subunit 2
MPKAKPSMRQVAAAAAAERARQESVHRRRLLVGVGAGVAAVVAVIVAVVLASGGAGHEQPAPRSELAAQLGCASCHTTDGSRAEGPTWQGLYGSIVTLADGTSVKADDAYLRQAIVDPSSQIVAGYTGGMPAKQLTDSQVTQLIAFIRTLG